MILYSVIKTVFHSFKLVLGLILVNACFSLDLLFNLPTNNSTFSIFFKFNEFYPSIFILITITNYFIFYS